MELDLCWKGVETNSIMIMVLYPSHQIWSIGKHLAGAYMWQNKMNMMNFKNKKNKKNWLSLGWKRKVDLTEDDNDEGSSSHARIENDIQTVSKFYNPMW